MCIIGDYRQIIAQREMGLTYSEIQVPRKKINRALQHNQGQDLSTVTWTQKWR